MSRVFMILGLLGLYTVFKAIQLLPSQPWVGAAIAIVFFVAMTAGLMVYRSDVSVFDKWWFRILSWFASLGMAAWATFIIISMPVDLVHGILWVFGIGFEPHIYLGVFILSIGLALIGFLQVKVGPRIKTVNVPVAHLHPSLNGFKIAQISDLHVGPTIRSSYVADVVKRTNAANADIIVMTGDIVDSHSTSASSHLLPLSALKSKFGSYYVTGNHEYYWDPAHIIAKLASLGVKPLVNANEVIQVGSAKLMVAGITDPMGQTLQGHTPNVDKAIASPTKVDYKILLAHRPDASDETAGHGVGLQFSGHTHAGQFFPFSLFIGLAHKYSRGLYEHGKMWVYVNPGTGYWGPANRLGVHPEITLAILVPAAGPTP